MLIRCDCPLLSRDRRASCVHAASFFNSRRKRELVELAKMSARRESLTLQDPEKQRPDPVDPAPLGDHIRGRQFSLEANDVAIVEADQGKLHRNLKGRHMQMIAM